MITIFTPTYNREKLLGRVYESLLAQTCKDFEWLIVDDGSSDGTSELVQRFIQERKIDIHYIKKENGGKHSAHNEALVHAKGKYFFCLDSDDILVSNAVETIVNTVNKLQSKDCGIIAYKCDTKENLLSGKFPENFSEHHGLYSLSQNCGISGEFTLVFRTEVLKEYPYPIIKNERFLSECVLYDKLESLGYTWYPLAAVLEICEYQADGLSNDFGRLLYNNPAGHALFLIQRVNLIKSLKNKIRYGISYNAFYRIARIKKHSVIREINLITISTWILGQLGAVYYFIKNSR